eukprot:s1779_g10.t1
MVDEGKEASLILVFRRGQCLRDCLRKLAVYETSWLRNMQYDLEGVAKAAEDCDAVRELQNFIETSNKEVSTGPALTRHVAMPFHQLGKGRDPRKMTPELQLHLQVQQQIRQLMDEMSPFIASLLEGSETEEEVEKFCQKLSDSKLRAAFCQVARLAVLKDDPAGTEIDGSAGKNLSPGAFEALTCCFKVALDAADEHNDAWSGAWAVLAQLYRTEQDGKAVSLLSKVYNHALWNKEEGDVRGVPSRPDKDSQPRWWPISFEWLIKLSLRMISDAASTSLHYCGTLCASIGLAARWSYWLAVATVALFLLQLFVWTCNWVLIPLFRHLVVFWRYLRGQGQWYELAQIHGVRVFRPKWYGPQGREEWTAAFVQQEVRGRGEGREPYDLLVTDGTAIARLRHGTLRGRTNRFGFKAECDSVHASSHRYYRNQLEGMECRVHLCAQRPCGQPDDDCLHAVAAAVIPRHLEFDLQDAAGKGPFARCASAAWLCGYSTAGMCSSFWKSMRKGLKCLFCSGCCCKSRKKPRNRGLPGSEASTPRHENSETESEAEDETSCQAESVAFLVNGKATPLSLVPCKDSARGNKVKLLPSDAEISSAEDLRHEDGNYYFGCCHHHRALYEGQAAKRTCVYEGCDREVKASKAGLRLCKLHGAKGEKVRPSTRTKSSSSSAKPADAPSPMPIEPEARFAPGIEAQTTSPPQDAQQGTQATSLGKYLREILQGKTDAAALKACANPGCGPRETWEELKEQATTYVTRLPKDYPPKARKAIVFLVTEDCPIQDWTSEDTGDPVLDLGTYSSASWELGERGESQKAVEVLPQANRSAPSLEGPPPPSAESLYRPRGSASLPNGMGMGGPQPQQNAYASFAAVSRPRHMGAYTDGESPQMDETTKALQAIVLRTKPPAMIRENWLQLVKWKRDLCSW